MHKGIFTEKELTVLSMVIEGKNLSTIAKELNRTPVAVSVMYRKIVDKIERVYEAVDILSNKGVLRIENSEVHLDHADPLRDMRK